MTDIDTQLALVPVSLQMFLEPTVKTEGRVAVWGQNFITACRPRSGVLPRQMGLAIQRDHRFEAKYTYSRTQNYKYYFLDSKSGNDVAYTFGTLDTI